MRYGLIGRRLSHSFSQQYFSGKFEAEGLPHRYDLYELERIEELPALLARYPDLVGLNVTIPYKTEVLRFLDGVDALAQQAGAVNTLRRLPDGRLLGYNTDIIGFTTALEAALARNRLPQPQQALILGTGGASRAVQVALHQKGIPFQVVGRRAGTTLYGNSYLLYEELGDIVPTTDLLVQTTPLGQYPEPEAAPPILYGQLRIGVLAFDMVYNPGETLFLKRCAAAGLHTENGLVMLYAQAEAAWAIWQQPFD